MGEIIVLEKAPVIMTKDKNWRPITKLVEGAIFLLPEDAVLIIPPTHLLTQNKDNA